MGFFVLFLFFNQFFSKEDLRCLVGLFKEDSKAVPHFECQLHGHLLFMLKCTRHFLYAFVNQFTNYYEVQCGGH